MKLERVRFIVVALALVLYCIPTFTATVEAAAAPACPGGLVPDVSGHCPGDPLVGSGGRVCVAVPIFASGGTGGCPAGTVEIPNNPGSGGAIIFYLKLVLKLLSGSVGAIIILMMVIAGIQYITSSGDATRVKNAKNRLVSALIALVLFMMMFAILNFFVPGGILT